MIFQNSLLKSKKKSIIIVPFRGTGSAAADGAFVRTGIFIGGVRSLPCEKIALQVFICSASAVCTSTEAGAI